MIYCKLILMAMFWSGTFIAGRYLGGYVAPLQIVLYRYALACLFLFTWVLYRKKHRAYTPKQHLGFFLLGLTGVVLYNIFFFNALTFVDAGRVAMIVTSNPVVIALLSILIFNETAGKIKCLGIAINFFGVAMIVFDGNIGDTVQFGLSKGDWLSFLSLFSWVAYTFLTKKMLQRVDSLHAVFYSILYGVVILFVLSLWEPAPVSFFELGVDHMAIMVYLAFFGTVISFVWYNEGIEKIGTLRATAFINLVPVFVLVLSFFMLGEALTAFKFIGAALAITGLSLVNGLHNFLPIYKASGGLKK